MNCNFCGQEYEFSLGHRCRVMQEESKQPMPQPDLVSKLREALQTIIEVASGERQVAADDTGGMEWIDKFARESLLGREGQAAPEITVSRGATAKASTPSWDDAEWVEAQPSPSTPIVPGTAGLSADFFLEHETQYTQHKEFWVWECSCGAIEEEKFISHEECHVQTRRHWADRLNALLVTKPAEPRGLERELAESRSEFAVLSRACGNWREWPIGTISKDVPDYTHDDWKAAARAILERNELREREARIRKDAQEEAAQHKPQTYIKNSPITAGQDGVFTIGFLGCSCGWNSDGEDSKNGTWETHIRALAERPAPAGEVKQAPGSVRRAENEAVRLIALLVNELSGKPAPENRIRLVIQDALDVAQGNEPPSRRRGDVHGTA